MGDSAQDGRAGSCLGSVCRVSANSGTRFGRRAGVTADSVQYSGRGSDYVHIQSTDDRADVLFFLSSRRPLAWHGTRAVCDRVIDSLARQYLRIYLATAGARQHLGRIDKCCDRLRFSRCVLEIFDWQIQSQKEKKPLWLVACS